MTELTIEELKQVELNILKDVAKFCEAHDIKYFLCGGTLLGAIRHKGFILSPCRERIMNVSLNYIMDPMLVIMLIL